MRVLEDIGESKSVDPPQIIAVLYCLTTCHGFVFSG